MLKFSVSFSLGSGLQYEFPAPLWVTGSMDMLMVIPSMFCKGAIKRVCSPGEMKSFLILAYLREVNEIDLKKRGKVFRTNNIFKTAINFTFKLKIL